ncbi:MAG: hypothetical protein QOI73_1589 [Solirubrobacteraceae bacterium]|nr:hypothetical protein [Solirubrobacteraceae bacterium]
MGRRDREALRDRDARGLLSADEQELAVALARELLHGCGALRVSVALDAAAPAVIECERFGAIVVHEHDAEHALPHDAATGFALPELPLMRRLPPFEVDAETGAVAGMLGGLEMLGRALRELAAMLPGESVVAADFETTDPACPLGLAARRGEPVAVLLGEHEFELDP